MVCPGYRCLLPIHTIMTPNQQSLQSWGFSASFTPLLDANSMWRIADSLHLRSWGDEYVVYHPLSGDTHLLGKAAAHLLLALQQATTDTLSLSKSLASMLAVRTSSEFMLEMNKILADLNKLALIERK
ncbi:MAG: hypothetical protein COZ77_05645 [Gallionellales bacterium CG_4_8_14_3_um_filter_54_18]|nr:MAG: hypothetical protein COW45_07825 [Gallionellales bacterium CG17_big_fil_post_rev_8_21_14_2_50_54_146]PIX04597.1 MAG: hypothetical protein COZ77_05645 [Gallionellales bacterium CG_4_8_14_3_um_filter_54_18]